MGMSAAPLQSSSRRDKDFADDRALEGSNPRAAKTEGRKAPRTPGHRCCSGVSASGQGQEGLWSKPENPTPCLGRPLGFEFGRQSGAGSARPLCPSSPREWRANLTAPHPGQTHSPAAGL